MHSRPFIWSTKALLLCLSLFGIAHAQTPQPLDPSIRKGVLPNGMTYFLKHNTEPAKRAELRLAVKTGSVQEDDDQLGLAHFCEHMAFNGSQHFEKQALVDYLEGIGVKFGPHLNAYTSFDETVYMLQVPTDNPELLDKGLLVLEDWSKGLLFDPAEIDKERGVVVEEWRLRSGADSRLQQKYLPVLLNGSHYSKRLPIGDPELIKTFPHDAVIRFYKKWYRPELMSVIIVGDIDVDAMEKVLATKIGVASGPPSKIEIPTFPIQAHDDVRAVVATDKDASYGMIELCYKFPKEHIGDVEDYPRMLTDRLIGKMLENRIEVLKAAGKCPLLFASFNTGQFVGKGSGDAFTAFGIVGAEAARNGLKLVLEEIERARRFGFTAVEFERSKTNLLAEQDRRVKELEKTDSKAFINQIVYGFLNGFNPTSQVWRLEQMQTILPQLSLAQIDTRFKSVTQPKNMVMVITGPEAANQDYPTEAEALAMFNGLATAKLAAYTETADTRPLVSKPVAAIAPTQKSEMAKSGIQKLSYSNGITVVLKPTDFEANNIYFQAFREGGLSSAPDADLPSAMASSRIQSLAGVGDFDATTLESKLAGKKAELYIAFEAEYEELYGECASTDLETFLQLLYLNFASPRKDKMAFSTYMEESKAMLSFHLSPEGIFYDSLWANFYANHPRALLENEAFLSRLDYKKALKFYKGLMANPSGYQFVLVGSFDPAKISTLLDQYIGGIPAIGSPKPWQDRGIKMPSGQVNCTVKAGVDPKSSVSLVFSGAYSPEMPSAFKMKFMADVLSIMLRESLREDKGGVYGVRVDPAHTFKPARYFDFSIDFGCDPARTDELIAAVHTEIKRLQTEGPSEKNMEKVRETIRRTHEVNLRENEFWLEQITEMLRGNKPLDEMADIASMAANMTAMDVKVAAQKFLSGENLLKVVLMPKD